MHAVPQKQRREGFTLIEIMAVVLIIGILSAGVGLAVAGIVDDAKLNTTQQDIRSLEAALEFYRMDNGRYPSTEQGLRALIEKPTAGPPARRWRKGGYLNKSILPTDGWDSPFEYAQPGSHNADGFDIWSVGNDGTPGGGDDLGNWAPDQSEQ